MQENIFPAKSKVEFLFKFSKHIYFPYQFAQSFFSHNFRIVNSIALI
jgi:hypothetical protein